MSIPVVCPGCRKRYQVSEKFAGNTGPCPNCKYLIKVPDKSGEVKILTPEQFEKGGRSSTGKLVLKPIPREENKFDPLLAAGVACATGTIFAAAWLGGKVGLFKDNIFTAILGLVLISPQLALAAYTFLYDEELEPYRGKSLFIRSALCGLLYALLWGVFAYVSDIPLSGEVWNWLFIAPPFFAAGAMVAVTTLDLEYGTGFFHYSFYIFTIIILRWTAGMDWIWNMK